MNIYKKDYYSDELADVERDVYEAIQYNPLLKDMTDDELEKGIYTVTIKWREDDNE